MYIEKRGSENPFREKREKRSLFASRAARVLRVLLTPPLRAWKVLELQEASGVSLGQMSNVRKELFDREWAKAGKGEHAVLSSYSAARWFAPFARQVTQFFYADKSGAEVLKQHLHLQSVARGENVVILEPREDDVFSGRLEAAPGIWCSGLVQTWLDLSVAGERGREAADHLMREKLLPSWRKVAYTHSLSLVRSTELASHFAASTKKT